MCVSLDCLMRFRVLRHLKTSSVWLSMALIAVNPDHISQRLEVTGGPDLFRLPPHEKIHTRVITETSLNKPADLLDLCVCVCVCIHYCAGLCVCNQTTSLTISHCTQSLERSPWWDEIPTPSAKIQVSIQAEQPTFCQVSHRAVHSENSVRW